jgi:hypothetical protein
MKRQTGPTSHESSRGGSVGSAGGRGSQHPLSYRYRDVVAAPVAADPSKLKAAELRDRLAAAGADTKGVKAVLVDRPTALQATPPTCRRSAPPRSLSLAKFTPPFHAHRLRSPSPSPHDACPISFW